MVTLKGDVILYKFISNTTNATVLENHVLLNDQCVSGPTQRTSLVLCGEFCILMLIGAIA